MNGALFREYAHEEHAFWDYVDAIVSWRKVTMGKMAWMALYSLSNDGFHTVEPFDINGLLSYKMFWFLSTSLHDLIH